MEIKVNVETNAEEREDVELFEQERRKEEEFKNKLEEQIDSLISQNEKEISRRGLVTWNVNTLPKKFTLI